jgi:hypothetical protein
MFDFFSAFDEGDSGYIHQWVIGDDDARYAPTTLHGYQDALVDGNNNNFIMTHFNVHARLQVALDNELHHIGHVQVCRQT